MNTSYAKAETLTSAVLAPLDMARSLALIVAFSLLTALAAQVAIPLPGTLVPLTGQTFAVLLTGALLGSRLGALAMIAYLIEGASGLPFFYAGGGGVQHLLFSPTSGYLLAYPVAAFVVGLLAERGWDRRFLTAAAAMALGSVVILLGGWAWLARFMSPVAAWNFGVAPFLIGDLIKIALAAAVLPSGWAILRKTSRTH
ncbi:MAG: biotin transport system substrate-specific component [Acidobacteriota bacterium]|nr:biotin transport system substrate-specific component [Acidobacteriota bacterium]